jgi:hypothetical protein
MDLQWWDLYWIVPVALVVMIAGRVVVYMIWSIPIWTLETLQDGLRAWLLRREVLRGHSAEGD